MQYHFVLLKDAEQAMRDLEQVGMTTREACGNSVRNITSCPYAGIAHDEVFDITPYAEAMTRYFLGHPLSGVLPRKFKIAFEGCPTDHALASIHDLGWFARIGDGKRGFRLTIAGGTSIHGVSLQVLSTLLAALSLNAAGTGYAVNDRITLAGPGSNATLAPVLTVTGVSAGAITSFVISPFLSQMVRCFGNKIIVKIS